MFCKCGKLMTETSVGFKCVCGKTKDFFGNEMSESEVSFAESEAARISEIKKKYHSKYPNISDPIVRVTTPVPESDVFDETFSSLTPKQRVKQKKSR